MKTIRLFTLCMLLSGLSSLTFRHAFHTSITEIRLNTKEKTYEISVRLFTDDLQTALSKDNANQKFKLESKDKNDVFVEKYIKKHFGFVSPKNLRKNYTYIGKEQEGDATWIYIEMPANESLNNFKLQHDTLIETYDDQVNIVNIFLQNQKKSFIFNENDKIHELEL
jgi:hypothetical protein